MSISPHNYFFPSIKGLGTCISLQDVVRAWREKTGTAGPLVAANFSEIVKAQMKSAHWCSGGYLEYRPDCFTGTYMEKTSKFLHLGIDYSANEGTPVHFPLTVTVLRTDVFPGTDIDWGGRVFVQPQGCEFVFLLCHLDPTRLPMTGTTVVAQNTLGFLGAPDVNGGVWPHLHVQAMKLETFEKYAAQGFRGLDGYTTISQKEKMLETFPSPESVLQQIMPSSLKV